jgi:hypothetical protein
LQSSIWPSELPATASEAILGANDILGHSTRATAALTESQKTAIAAEVMALYVYGRITYSDVFHATHTTEYLYFHQKLPGAPQGVLSAYPTGNTAN